MSTSPPEDNRALESRIEALSKDLSHARESLSKEIENETEKIKTQLDNYKEILDERVKSVRRQWMIFLGCLGTFGLIILLINGVIWFDSREHGKTLDALLGRVGNVEGSLSTIGSAASVLNQTAADLSQVVGATRPLLGLDESMKLTATRIEEAAEKLGSQLEALSKALPEPPSEDGAPNEQ